VPRVFPEFNGSRKLRDNDRSAASSLLYTTSCKDSLVLMRMAEIIAPKHVGLIEIINPLTPNDPYRGRTAPLTSKVAFYIFIQQI